MKYQVVGEYGDYHILNTEAEDGERIKVTDPGEVLGFRWENLDGRFVSHRYKPRGGCEPYTFIEKEDAEAFAAALNLGAEIQKNHVFIDDWVHGAPRPKAFNGEDVVSKPPEIVGLTIKKAQERAEKAGFRVREIERDGQAFVGTCDFLNNRMNVITKEGKIVEVRDLG